MATMIRTGTYTGNGSAQNISLGFMPDYVEIIDTTGLVVYKWVSNMATGTAYKAATDTVVASIVANPNGVSQFAGSSSAGAGFTVGTSLSTNASVYRYVAMQNGPGAQ